MARIKRDKIFLSGKLHSGETRDDMIILYSHIVKTVEKCGYDVHPNFLTSTQISAGVQPDVRTLKFAGTTFGKLMDATPVATIKYLKKSRVYRDGDTLLRCATTARITAEQLKRSVAGIFLLTEESGGALFNLGFLVRAQVPCLCVSDRDNFGTMITGDPSRLLFTQIYKSHAHLKEIVGNFMNELPGLKAKQFSIQVKAALLAKFRAAAIEQGVDVNDLIEEAMLEKMQ